MNPRIRYLVGTLVLLAVGFGYALSQGRPHTPPPRPAASAAVPAPLAPAPSAREILARADALRLTGEQRDRLRVLDDAWRAESAGLESAVKAASEEFARHMDDAQKAGRVSLADIQRQSEDVRELGGALRERRRLHAEAAAGILTEEQRRELGPARVTGPSGGTR